MRVLVVAVGRAKGGLAPAIAEYEKRAARYWKLEVAEVSAGARGGKGSSDRVRAAEAERILAKLPGELELVALTRVGARMGSEELAKYLEDRAVRSSAGVAFAIGGAFGLGDSVLARAHRQLSISAMTLPHDMARLVLCEQLYRAGTIVRGEPYHKG